MLLILRTRHPDEASSYPMMKFERVVLYVAEGCLAVRVENKAPAKQTSGVELISARRCDITPV